MQLQVCFHGFCIRILLILLVILGLLFVVCLTFFVSPLLCKNLNKKNYNNLICREGFFNPSFSVRFLFGVVMILGLKRRSY